MDSAREKPLRAALVGNATFSGLFAVMLLLFPSEFASLAGLSSFRPAILAVSLLAYGAWLLSNGLRGELKISYARVAIVLDVAWVVLSVPVALLSPLTNGGRALVVAVGGVVSLFAWLQWRGIRLIRAIQARHV
jgi:hypothetical protein